MNVTSKNPDSAGYGESKPAQHTGCSHIFGVTEPDHGSAAIMIVVAAICLLLLPQPVAASDPPMEIYSEVDWVDGKLMISVALSLSGFRSPIEARATAEDLVSRKIGSIFCEVLYDVILDSHRTVKQAFENDPGTLAALADIGSSNTPSNIHMSPELEKITALFEYSLYPDIMSVFTTHVHSYEPPEVLEFVPTLEYSGVVIYIGGNYPVHGEPSAAEDLARFAPSFRPRIYDTNMRIMAEPEMMDPAALNSWGLAAFTHSADYLAYKYRVGSTPLLTMAREVFGDYRTDIILPADAVDEILANHNNRELIRNGRILIIYGE